MTQLGRKSAWKIDPPSATGQALNGGRSRKRFCTESSGSKRPTTATLMRVSAFSNSRKGPWFFTKSRKCRKRGACLISYVRTPHGRKDGFIQNTKNPLICLQLRTLLTKRKRPPLLRRKAAILISGSPGRTAGITGGQPWFYNKFRWLTRNGAWCLLDESSFHETLDALPS